MVPKPCGGAVAPRFLDTNGNGGVSPEELARGLHRLWGFHKGDDHFNSPAFAQRRRPRPRDAEELLHTMLPLSANWLFSVFFLAGWAYTS